MEIAQRSPEWYAARAGKVTASRIADLMARTRSGWGASRQNYMAELIVERLTGHPADTYQSAAMRWGIETEPQARDAYAFFSDIDVVQVGFVDHPRIAMSGASPDGLVGADGLAEFKCPNTNTHIDTLLSGVIPEKYVLQMQWQIACTGRKWCDYVSFDPRMPEHMRYFCQRVSRNDKLIENLESEVSLFQSEIAQKIAALHTKYPERIAA